MKIISRPGARWELFCIALVALGLPLTAFTTSKILIAAIALLSSALSTFFFNPPVSQVADQQNRKSFLIRWVFFPLGLLVFGITLFYSTKWYTDMFTRFVAYTEIYSGVTHLALTAFYYHRYAHRKPVELDQGAE